MLHLILGWGWRVRRLRRKWDRIREKALKKSEPLRSTALQRLDQIEQNLRILEERQLNRFERARIAKEVEIDLAEAKAMVKAKPEELQPTTPYTPEYKQGK